MKLDKNTATAAGAVLALWLMWRSARPFSWPIAGQRRILRSFGPIARERAIEGVEVKAANYRDRWHTGIDLEAPTGTPVHAAAAGTVSYVERWGASPAIAVSGSTSAGDHTDWDGSYHRGMGVFVEIDHGSYRTRYCHLSIASVEVGQQVARGEQIGLTGESGHAGTPRLHWEIRRLDLGGLPVDPLGLVRG